ncbi:MAG: peptidoglycan editing factor PgeF [Betaproteobacteria bacterium]
MSTAAATDAALADALRRAGHDWIVPEWPAPPRVAAFVTTRNGGVSAGRFASLNLHAARPLGDSAAAVAENHARVRAFLPAAPVWLAQVHGNAVHVAGKARGAGETAPVADGAVARAADVVLAVQSADCLPVLLADRVGAAVAIAHAGWRGLAAGVVGNAVRALAIPPHRVVAWLGPAIGPDAFEVGEDVRAAFGGEDGAGAAFRPEAAGKWYADLYALARRCLAQCGVHEVYGGGACTYSEPARFFSYRRDGDTGRMAALLWLR